MENTTEVQQTIQEITELGYKALTLNENQVSKIIGVSPSTLSNWRSELIGIPFKKMGNGKRGRVLYTKRNVAYWLLNNDLKTA